MEYVPMRFYMTMLLLGYLTGCANSVPANTGDTSEPNVSDETDAREDDDDDATAPLRDIGGRDDDVVQPDATTTDANSPDAAESDTRDDIVEDAAPSEDADAAIPCTSDEPCGSTATCVDGVCVAKPCEANSRSCESGAVALVCNADGTLLTRTDCSTLPGCEGGACACDDGTCLLAQPCTPGQTTCLGNTPGTCNEDGTGIEPGTPCDPAAATVCEDGLCTCAEGDFFCAGRCANPQTDPSNCGTCGTECTAGQVCQSGLCACPVGATECGDACTDLQSDETNCGTCGNICAAGQTCSAGVCTCAGGLTACGAFCIDTNENPSNCGSCGNICATDQECKAGACDCVDPAETLCGRSCSDLAIDPRNCGACGTSCPTGVACVDGECICPSGLTLCGDRCVDTRNDPDNCGTCGNDCGTGTCNAGICNVSTTCACGGFFTACSAADCRWGRPCCAPVFPGCFAVALGDDELRSECR
jgi:hypothetical protein